MAETKSSFEGKRWTLDGITALVTGGTKGIGHTIAEELAEFGAAVHICARNEADIDKCLKDWQSKGFTVTGSVCDVLSHEQPKTLMETVSSIFQGKHNMLVNNAGLLIPRKSTMLLKNQERLQQWLLSYSFLLLHGSMDTLYMRMELS